ncbi:phage tail domain-containing protein [Arthrobacter sp. efr-133-TYG-118]|uniref:phage distal tail protein n=1 Tax=Arthrobacter sp. efr-133-TYG-118 TaxID=3040279 RepID=UPI002549FCEE|nr:phage tail domain-containing protein [Arthrobacter sp. efr-133-TYG-118]
MPAVVFAAGGLAPFQVFISSTGTVVGAGAAGISLLSVTGLRDLSGLRTGDAPRALADGSYPGLNYLDERVVTIKWDLTLASGLETALQVLAAGFQNVADPSSICMTSGDFLRQVAGVGATKPVSSLQFQLPGRTSPLVTFGRPTKHVVPIDLNYQWGQTQPASEWTSADGEVYDATVISAATSLPSPTSGMAWPAAFPWTFGSSSGGSMQLNNTGNYAAKPLFMIQGPVSYPKITHTNSGQTMYLNIVLGAADILILDHQAGTVTLNGTANRNNLVGFGSSFFTLSPGNNGIGFSSADSSAVAGTLTGYLLPTYSTV